MAGYERFVQEGQGIDSVWQHLNRQVFLGADASVARAHRQASRRPDDINIPRAQQRPPAPSLKEIAATHADRDAAMRAAWATGEYSYAQTGAHFEVHFTTVGRVVRTSA